MPRPVLRNENFWVLSQRLVEVGDQIVLAFESNRNPQ
jgi:hypothetical protein